MAEIPLRYLLLQMRNGNDPMRAQEVGCFARALRCSKQQIEIFDLLQGAPSQARLAEFDCVLLGGSGDYSVASGGTWLNAAMSTMQTLCETSKPTFASCWGCQAMARAMGGEVITDPERAEIGSVEVELTAEGQADHLFASLGARFFAQMGHQDRIAVLPEGAVRLARSELVENQAFCFPGKPIYCTQFHPELDRTSLLERLIAYPQYVEQISGLTIEEFAPSCRESPETDRLLYLFAAELK